MTDLVKSTRLFSDEEMADISSYADVERAIAEKGLGVLDYAEVFGTGFIVLDKDEKRQLIGVPFAIIDYRFNIDEENGGAFVSLAVVTEDGRKFIVNDGGTGIYEQMLYVDKKSGGVKGVIRLRKGLRVSDYIHEDEKGKRTPASTFYLNTSK